VWLRISCCERSCAHLTGAVKSNSSETEVWSGSLVLAGSRSSGALIEERLNIESTSMWIRGDRQVIDTTAYNSSLVLGYFFAQFPFKYFTLSIYFLEIELYLATLGCKPPT
jgi:hypothetical protein